MSRIPTVLELQDENTSLKAEIFRLGIKLIILNLI